MRFLLLAFLLVGCSTWSRKDDVATIQPAEVSEKAQLSKIWEDEVDDAIAGLTAIKPFVSFKENAGDLYDAQLSGLVALSGPPSVPAVNKKTKIIKDKNGSDSIKRLNAEKEELDSRTTDLENKAKEAEIARITAEAKAEAAAEDARLSEAASNLSRVASGAIAIGVLAFLFGHLLAIPKWAAAATVALGVLVSTMAPQLLSFFGSNYARYIMASTMALLAISLVFTVSVKVWNYSKSNIK